MKRSKRKPEEWRDIKDFEGIYQVSSHGRVKSLERLDSRGRKVNERILKGNPNNSGYPLLTLHKEGCQKGGLVHRLVAEAFIPNPDNKPEVDHKYGEKTNNYYEDLRWGTRQEQSDWANGEQGLTNPVSGESHSGATLTNDQVEEIIRLLQKGNTPKSISNQYNVRPTLISQINNGNSWNNILPEVPRPIFNFLNKKLTTEKVEEVINELKSTNKIAKVIAEDHNVSIGSVNRINTGTRHKDVLPHIQRPIRSKTNKDRA